MEYIHSQKIIHRDIKPANLVLDERGYVRIIDFGIAQYYSDNNAKERSGTSFYMAPEVMLGMNHSYTVDFFALGVIGYQFMLNKNMYIGKNTKEIKEEMLSKQTYISSRDIPYGWSKEAASFIIQLLERNPEYRLGNKGIYELKQHVWLRDFSWEQLVKKQLEAPFISESKYNYDLTHCNKNENNDLNIEKYNLYKNSTDY